MRSFVASGLLSVVLAASPMLVGCDKELSKDETVHKNADGSMTKDSTVVTQQPDGTVVKTHDASKTP